MCRRNVLQDLLTPYLVAAETTYPESLAVLKGMSVGAMVPVLELFAINAFEELEPLLANPEGGGLLFLQRKEGYLQPPLPPFTERCSSFSVTSPASRSSRTTSTGWRGTSGTSP